MKASTKPIPKKVTRKEVRLKNKSEMKNEGEPNPRQILRTDFGNAELFAERCGNDIRYCYESRKWLIWDGRRWVEDNTGEIYRRGKDCIKRLLRSAVNIKDQDHKEWLVRHAIRSQTVTRLRAMVELTQSEPGLQVEQSGP
jgi:putative DNA primase/helicase